MAKTELQTSVLVAYEEVIRQGFDVFLEVGDALIAIRDGEHYKPSYKSFSEYLRKRWDFSRQWAYSIMDAAATAKKLSSKVDNSGATKADLLALSDVPEECVDEAIQEVQGQEECKPSIKDVRRAVERKLPAKDIDPDETSIPRQSTSFEECDTSGQETANDEQYRCPHCDEREEDCICDQTHSDPRGEESDENEGTIPKRWELHLEEHENWFHEELDVVHNDTELFSGDMLEQLYHSINEMHKRAVKEPAFQQFREESNDWILAAENYVDSLDAVHQWISVKTQLTGLLTKVSKKIQLAQLEVTK